MQNIVIILFFDSKDKEFFARLIGSIFFKLLGAAYREKFL